MRFGNMPGDVSRQSAYDTEHCDEHPDRKALFRLTGETDSMGSEFHYQCQECNDRHKEAVKNAPPTIGTCEWCNTQDTKLDFHRDWEEGTSGPVYQLCKSCIGKNIKASYGE